MNQFTANVVRAQLLSAKNDIDQLTKLNLGESRVNSALLSLLVALETLADIVGVNGPEETESGITGGGINVDTGEPFTL